MLIKSRARVPLVIQLPASLQPSTEPLTRMSVRRSRRAKNARGEPEDQRVLVELRLPGAITLMPGEKREVDAGLKELDQFKSAVGRRAIIVLREDPPQPARKPRRARK